MKFYYTFQVLLLLLPGITSAQSGYKPGFAIISNGDTVKGDILYRKWANNPSEFSFKSSDGNKKAFNVHNSQTVCIDSRAVYKCFVVWLSEDRPVNLDVIAGIDNTVGIDSTKKLDTVFLQVIASGKNVILYSYTDLIKQRFFIGQKNNVPVELILHQYIEQEPELTVAEDAKYKNQLQRLRALYVPENTKLIDEIQLAEYKEEDLSAIVNKLNK